MEIDMEMFYNLIRDDVEYDVVIEYDCELREKGYAGTYYDPPMADEYECSIVDIELYRYGKDVPPLTDAEKAQIKAWFELNHDEAVDWAIA
jgi:hypothetical protein